MPDLANKYGDIVNLQGAEAYCVAMRTACYYYCYYYSELAYSLY